MRALLLTIGWTFLPLVEPPRPFSEPKPLFEHGTIVIKQDREYSPKGELGSRKNTLLADGINWGFQYLPPNRDDPRFSTAKTDRTRLATTYYARRGPFGCVMERYNWFPDRKNDNRFSADVRMPASLIGLGAHSLSMSPVPTNMLVGAWSEPPVAVLGLGAGTPASYARPLQSMDFYERDKVLIPLSMPIKGKRYFTFVHDAKKRGAHIRIFPGKERKSLVKRGPKNYYHVMLVEMCSRNYQETLKVELLTKEGMAACFDALVDDGILCIHTSNRYYNAPRIIADVAHSLGFVTRRGHDQAPLSAKSHFTSEWVIVARRAEVLDGVQAPPDYGAKLRMQNRTGNPRIFVNVNAPYWEVPIVRGQHAWTDKSPHKLLGILRSDPTVHMRARRYDQWLRFLTNDWMNQYTSRWRDGVYGMARNSALRRQKLGQTVEDLP